MSNQKESLYSEILPNLYISGTLDEDIVPLGKSVDVLSQNNPFDSLVCLYGHANPAGYFVREQRYGILDGEIDMNTVPEIIELAFWLHKEWKSGKRAAAKCQAGWNRSALIVALVLVIEGYTANDAIAMIRRKRSQFALSNGYFTKFIKEFEDNQYKTNKANKAA